MTEAMPAGGLGRGRLSVSGWRLGWSEGDAWTVGIGLVLATTLAVSTVPAVLDARNAAPRAVTPAFAAPGTAGPGAATEPGAAAQALPDAAAPQAQPLLGPLVPPAPFAAPGEAPVPVPPAVQGDVQPAAGGPTSPAGPALPVPGEVRRFAAVRSGGAPGSVATSGDGDVWAGTDMPGQGGTPALLLRYDAAGSQKGSSPVPEQPADRTRGLTGLSRSVDGSLVAVDAATSRLLRYDPEAGQWETLAQVPDVRPCLVLTSAPCQPGLLDTAPLLRGVAVDAAGSSYVADAGQGTVWRVRPGRPVEQWFSSADVAGEQGLAGLATDAAGHLLVVVTRLGGLQSTTTGALLRIERAADGSAGARTVVAAFSAGEDPVDVALGTSGNAYVALRGADAVVTLDRTGAEQLRVVDDALQDPTALDLAAGRLLVAAAEPAPAVLQIGVDDAPLPLPTPPPTAGGPSRG